MRILVNKAHYPVDVLGYGRRLGIWLQGCSIRCPSCCSKDTWDFDGDRGMDVESLVGWGTEVSSDGVDGITVSGGEPFDQPEALHHLLLAFHDWISKESLGFDILVYSGYSESRLRRDFADHLSLIDALVVGPFRESEGGDKPYCGSDNQRMVSLSPLGESRYGHDLAEKWKTGMQVSVDDEGVWMIGIPRPGDLKRIEAGCASRGLVLREPSWRC